MQMTRPLLAVTAALTLFAAACSTPEVFQAPSLEPQFGTPETDSGHDVTVDLSGRVYVVGVTDGDLARSDLGGSDAFVRRYAREDQARGL